MEVPFKGGASLPDNIAGKIDFDVLDETTSLCRLRPFDDPFVILDARQHYYTSHSVLGPYAIIPHPCGMCDRLRAMAEDVAMPPLKMHVK